MLFFIVWGKGREDRIKYDIFRENSGVQGLLTGLKQEWPQWFGHVKRMDRTRILRRELELKSMEQFRRGWFSNILEGINKKMIASKELKRED